MTNVPWKDHPLVGTARRFIDGLKAHNAFEAAAAIAFWFFLSFLPLLVLLGFLVGQIARSKGVDALLTPVLDIVPSTAEDIVRHELERMAGNTATVAPLGIVGYLWTASSGLHNLMDVFEVAVKVARRPWWKQRAIALGWVLAGLATACLLAWLLVRIDAAIHADDPAPTDVPASTSLSTSTPAPTATSTPTTTPTSSAHASHGGADHHTTTTHTVRGAFKHRLSKAIHTPTEQLLGTALMLALGMALLAGFYRFAVEHPPGVRRRVWPGTLTAVGCWLVVSWVFGVYVVSMSTYALYYGSLAAVAVLLVWLYLTSLSLVVGAAVNAQLETAGQEG